MSSLLNLSCEEILSLLKTSPIFEDATIDKFREQIATYIEVNNIDGAKLLSVRRKQFGQDIVDFYNDKKIRGAANKTHDKFIKLNPITSPHIHNNHHYQFTEMKCQEELVAIHTMFKSIPPPAIGNKNNLSNNEPSSSSCNIIDTSKLNDHTQEPSVPSNSKPNPTFSTYKDSKVCYIPMKIMIMIHAAMDINRKKVLIIQGSQRRLINRISQR